MRGTVATILFAKHLSANLVIERSLNHLTVRRATLDETTLEKSSHAVAPHRTIVAPAACFPSRMSRHSIPRSFAQRAFVPGVLPKGKHVAGKLPPLARKPALRRRHTGIARAVLPGTQDVNQVAYTCFLAIAVYLSSYATDGVGIDGHRL
eukprot:gnl/TRDRNA2_/TRDRNA2_28918_c1_seq1.p1 gnl/TRDRNA2_/TRDRNA2_28918_c1~~gnl/TRDRNA2_/TRDRNA2_28918_c1_seq1.p1  ORF type:complete len:150 (+),score=12.02 gnl/TRDRNA2_/TRDRNA2_28918_c1_seq1:53-502(+)